MLFISCLMVLGMAWLINVSFQTGLENYLNRGEEEKLQLVAERIAPYYSAEDGWQQLRHHEWKTVITQIFAKPTIGSKKSVQLRDSRIKHVMRRITLLDEALAPVFKQRKSQSNDERMQIPIKYNQQTVGWITTVKHTVVSDVLAEGFYQQQQKNLMWIVLWVALLSIALAWFLVRHLLTPLKRLEVAAHSLQEGDYQTQIEVHGEDELAALSTSFNELSRSLLLQKETREQWLADISHELRTPISVLKSEIEALQDGIRQAQPKYIDSLHHQVQNLSQLVEDLYQLSLSDAGLKFDLTERINMQQMLIASCSQYTLRLQEKQIHLQTVLTDQETCWVQGDKKSLLQLLTNLFENSLRYTDGPGVLQVQLNTFDNKLQLCISDSAPAVPNESLPKLFERLYRVDKSRSRVSGGAGLGLSICQTIALAHQGELLATHSDLGGLAITLTLPLMKE